MAYQKPQILLFQEFSANPSLQLLPIRACLVGGHAFVRRHSVAAERALSSIGAYSPDDGVVGSWPGRPNGAVVDPRYTRVFMDKARLQYFEDLIGSGQTVAPVNGKASQIRINGSNGFAANGSSFPRLSGLRGRDVQPGDLVTLRGDVDDVSHTFETYVRSVLADPTSSTVGSATAADTNHPDQNSSLNVNQTAGAELAIAVQASTSGYSALADGALADVYTVAVTRSSTGADFTTARLRVTTASGLDDDLVVTPAAANTQFSIGVRGLTIAFINLQENSTDNLTVGQVWTITINQGYAALSATAAGTYTGEDDTTYVVEVIRGGLFQDNDLSKRPLIRVTTTTGTDNSGPTSLNTAAGPYPVGTKGVTIAFPSQNYGVAKGDRWLIPTTASKNGRYAILSLGHALPAPLLGLTDLDLTLSIERDVEIPELSADGLSTYWSGDATTITVEPNLTATDPAIAVAGVPAALPITRGTVTVEYLAWRSDYANRVNGLNDIAGIDVAIPGALDPLNPIKYGLSKALINSNGTEVKFLIVADPRDPNSWTAALSHLTLRDDIHGVVPLTDDRSIVDVVQAHVESQSSPALAHWRALWTSIPVDKTAVVVDATTTTNQLTAMGQIGDDPDSSGQQYTLLTVSSDNCSFLAAGVRPGDVVRTGYATFGGVTTYSTHVVDAVLAENQLRLLAGVSGPTVAPQKFEIWRVLSSSEVAEAIRNVSASFGSRRVRHVVTAGVLRSGGVEVPGYYLAAALAGYRSGILPQASLTNATVGGFDTVDNLLTGFSETDLDTMAEGGTWIVYRTSSGALVTRHGLTTEAASSVASLAEREESMVSNLDAISYIFYGLFAPLVGRMNLTPATALAIRTNIQQTIDMLKSNGANSLLGSSLIEGEITICRINQIQADTLDVEIDVTLPAPFNYGKIVLVVQ
jgi:hypothetical protein